MQFIALILEIEDGPGLRSVWCSSQWEGTSRTCLVLILCLSWMNCPWLLWVNLDVSVSVRNRNRKHDPRPQRHCGPNAGPRAIEPSRRRWRELGSNLVLEKVQLGIR